MRNQTSFRLTTTLLPTDTTAKTTQVINKVDADGNQFYPTFTEETVVITNDDRTIMETTRATCSNGVLTFVKRGLSDDSSATEVANRKLTWNPGSICFITAGAADMVDVDDDNYWTGKQTYTGDMEAQGKATYKGKLITEKGVQYPSFADTTALNAYSDPFGGMFATVEDTGELYRYNAVTEQWDLVSTSELSDFIIRESEDVPGESTADNIITIVDTKGEIYLGDTLVSQVNNNKYVDVLVVGAGGLGGDGGTGSSYNTYRGAGGGGAGGFAEFMKYPTDKIVPIKVGCSNYRNCSCVTSNSGTSMFGNLIAEQGCEGNGSTWCPNGGQQGAAVNVAYQHSGGEGKPMAGCYDYWGGGGAGAGQNGLDAKTLGTPVNGGAGRKSFINNQTYGYGGQGGNTGGCCNVCGSGGGGIGGDGKKNGCTSCASGGIVVVRYPADGSYGFSNAVGGCVSRYGEYILHTFTEDGEFTIVDNTRSLKYLVVGGGGAGQRSGGGGGAVCIGYTSVNANSIPVVVGAGGSKSKSAPTGGCASCLGNIVAPGGCVGGSNPGGTSGSGCAGSEWYDCGMNYGAGGGGGAGGDGVANSCCYLGGTGGIGICGYGGGGGGGTGSRTNGGGSSSDGGGVGSSSCGGDCGGDATNYGGGGGGARYAMCDSCTAMGGAGCQGVVDVCYPTDGSYGFSCATGGNCCYTCNGYCVHRFTADGTFCIVS